MNTLDTIARRASYRGAYLPEPVPREHLTAILQAGLDAPSGCNKQTTSLIAVDDPALLARLFATMENPRGETAPAMICVLTERIIAYGDRCFATQDYAAAIENMLLAISDLGYESVWIEGMITGINTSGRQMADILGVPENLELVCYLPIGKAAEPVTRKAKKPFHERAWFNGYGK